MEPILELRNLRKSFGGLVAVNNLSFSVAPGEILGFIGPNGAGKTTVFNLIMGVHKPDSGRIIFKGQDITGWRTYQIVNFGLARVFQIARFFRHKTIYENIEVSAISNRIFSLEDLQTCQQRIFEASALVGLQDLLGWLPGTLPQAGLRRLEIAKSIATDPELLLLDEPFAGLSASEVEEISALIAELRAGGRTIVLVDHNMRGVMELVDRVVVINFGQKIAEGTPEEVVQNKDVQEAYLAGGGI